MASKVLKYEPQPGLGQKIHGIDFAKQTEDMLTDVLDVADTAINTVTDVIDQLVDAGDAQVARIVTEGDTQDARVIVQGNTQDARVLAQGNTQFTRLQSEGDSQYIRITDEANDQMAAITTVGTTQFDKVNAEGIKQFDLVHTEGVAQVAAATTQANIATGAASGATVSAEEAAASAVLAAASRDNAAEQSLNAATMATKASVSENNAAGSATTAKGEADAAATSATNAATSVVQASTQAAAAASSATAAGLQATNAGASAVRAATSATAALADADRAEDAADRAADMTGVGLTSKENYGMVKIGENLTVVNGVVSATVSRVVSPPVITFPANVAVGYSETIALTASTNVNGAIISHFYVRLKGDTEPREIAAVNNAATLAWVVEGNDSEVGKVTAQAKDSYGNFSDIATYTYTAHVMVVQKGIVISPVEGAVDVPLTFPLTFAPVAVDGGMPFTPKNTEIIVEITILMPDGGTDWMRAISEVVPYTTSVAPGSDTAASLSGYLGPARTMVRHEVDKYGWGPFSEEVHFTLIAREIVTPTVLTPQNGATDIAFMPTYTTSAMTTTGAAGTPMYAQLQVATDEAFTDIVFDTGETLAYATSIEHTGERLQQGTAYFVRVRYFGKFGDGHSQLFPWSAWSAVSSFTTTLAYIEAPTISWDFGGYMNEDGVEVCNTFNPDIKISPVVVVGMDDTPTNTQFVISQSADFNDTTNLDSGLDYKYSLYFEPPTPSEKQYFSQHMADALYVRARHKTAILGWSPWSEPRVFVAYEIHMMDAAPALPLDGSTDVPHQMTYKQNAPTITKNNPVGEDYTASVCSINVYLENDLYGDIVVSLGGTSVDYPFSVTDSGPVDPKYNNTRMVVSGTVSIDYKKKPTALSTWGMHRDSSHNTIYFTFINVHTDYPTITAPAQDSTTTTLKPTISWSAFVNVNGTDTPTQTHMQVDDNPDFSSPIYDSTDAAVYATSYTPTVNFPINTKLYVRVRHKGNAWGWSEWSVTRAFTTQNVYVKPPTWVMPANGVSPVNLTIHINPPIFAGTTIFHYGVRLSETIDGLYVAQPTEHFRLGAGVDFSKGIDIIIPNLQWGKKYYTLVEYAGQEEHLGAIYWVQSFTPDGGTDIRNPASFTTMVVSLETPTIILPVLPAINQPVRPTFTFSDPVVVGQTLTGMIIILHTIGTIDEYYNTNVIPYSKTHTITKDLLKGGVYDCYVAYIGSITGQTPWINLGTLTVISASVGDKWEIGGLTEWTPPIPGATYGVCIIGGGGCGGVDGLSSDPPTNLQNIFGKSGALGGGGGDGVIGSTQSFNTGGGGGSGYVAYAQAVLREKLVFVWGGGGGYGSSYSNPGFASSVSGGVVLSAAGGAAGRHAANSGGGPSNGGAGGSGGGAGTPGQGRGGAGQSGSGGTYGTDRGGNGTYSGILFNLPELQYANDIFHLGITGYGGSGAGIEPPDMWGSGGGQGGGGGGGGLVSANAPIGGGGGVGIKPFIILIAVP